MEEKRREAILCKLSDRFVGTRKYLKAQRTACRAHVGGVQIIGLAASLITLAN